MSQVAGRSQVAGISPGAGMSQVRGNQPGRGNEAIEREVHRHASLLGEAIRQERLRRDLSMCELARMAQVGLTSIHDLEAAEPGSLAMYVRLGRVLQLRREFVLSPDRARSQRRQRDPVHAAMGEVLAAHFRALGFEVGIDEPYQHYQFAGRVDVAIADRERAALLAIENRTQFPDVQEAAGAFNAKRTYFGSEFAERLGVRRWASETHVMLALWSAEALHQLRLHRSTFAGLCPDGGDAWEGWWAATPPPRGLHRVLVVFDPLAGRRRDRARWVTGDAADRVRPRYRDYAEAAEALGRPKTDGS